MVEEIFPYTIDHDDRIVSVGEAWLEFARENGAANLTRGAVLGRSLWDFVAGTETRLLYEGLFERVRSGEGPFVIPFRCDSPERFRFMRLVVQRSTGGAIDIQGTLVREQQRPFYSILDQAFPRSESSLPMCSLCKKVQAFGLRWLELEDALRELDLFGAPAVPRIDYVVCDDCAWQDPKSAGGCAA